MEHNQSWKNLFIEVSALLTGFNAVELQGTGMTETYYQTVVTRNSPSDVAYFFAAVAEILEQAAGDEATAEALIRARLIPDSCYNSLAKNIILMWYTGQWFQNTDNPATITSATINGQAYVNSLMWVAAQTHPSGANMPGYSSWSEPPIQIP